MNEYELKAFLAEAKIRHRVYRGDYSSEFWELLYRALEKVMKDDEKVLSRK